MKRVFLEGPIAVGKSAVMEQIALDEEGWSLSPEPLRKLEGRYLMDGTFREFLKPYYQQRTPEISRLMQVEEGGETLYTDSLTFRFRPR